MNKQILLLEQQLDDIKNKIYKLEGQKDFNKEIYLLFKEKIIIQRELSLIKGMETAVPINYPYPWNAGAPLPHVISDGYKTFLIYYIGENDARWESQTHTIIDLNTQNDYITALVQFNICYCYKFGGANDEVIYGHPLYEHGLEAYQGHIIKNSEWIKEEAKINSVHSNYSQKFWDKMKHYIFTFHDEMFECIANDYKVELFKGTIKSVYDEATKRLFD